MTRYLLACVASSLLATLSFAAPITYQESVSGDLPGFDPLPLFTLDVGVNTVSGTTGFPAPSGVDFDFFAFTVPAGLEVFAGGVSTQDISPQGDLSGLTWTLKSGVATVFGGTPLQIISGDPSYNLSFSTLPLGPGVYSLGDPAGLTGGGQSRPFLANYTFTFEVRSTAPIPEPATLTLFGGMMAFGGLWARRRRTVV